MTLLGCLNHKISVLNFIFAENTSSVEFNGPEYWQKIQKGDKQAFELMFRTYYQPLCNYACSTVKDMDDAQEIVQNTFFNIWNKKNSLDVRSSMKAYLYRAVHNDCLNRLKHAKVKRMYAEDQQAVMTRTSEDSSKQMQVKELNVLVNKAIDSLPEQCGHIFKLSRFESMKYSEIAEHLNISVKTVENHMGKALKILREQLTDYLPLLIILLSLKL
jgi:RNA polymerase sigma-70 factor (ECF subfamily)